MDDIDRAQENQARDIRDALARRQGPPLGKSLTICIDCLEEIPKKRRDAQKGCTRCIECQRNFDRRNR